MVFNANTKLKGIIDDFRKDYNQTAERTREEFMKGLPAGARVPDQGKIYNKDQEQAFRNRAIEYKAQAEAILDDHLKEVHEKMTDAPSSEMTNTIALLSTRGNITNSDIEHLAQRNRENGNNFQVHRALQDLGAKNHVIVPDHELTQQETALNDLKHSISSALTCETAAGRSDAFYAFLATQVDQTIVD